MQLRGHPASEGRIEGTARVVLTLSKIGNFNQGEILVTKVTSPDWTPLIHTSGGVITELGGVLSHAAIVSREYGIPAVVGVKGATEKKPHPIL